MKKTKNAFSLIELVIAMIVLIIVGAVGASSYMGHLKSVRDSSRLEGLGNIKIGLEYMKAINRLPNPDSSINIESAGIIIGKQGYAGSSVLSAIGYKDAGKDPEDDTYYSYYITKHREAFQLLALLEDASTLDMIGISKQAFAETPNYEERIPKLIGEKLGILLDTRNTPAQELEENINSGAIDLSTTTSIYRAYLEDNTYIEGTGATLMASIWNRSCKTIRDAGLDKGDGIYTINPLGVLEMDAYCDMTTTGGGRTLVHKTTDTTVNPLSGALDTTEGVGNWENNTEYRMSIANWTALSTSDYMAKNIRIDGAQWNDTSTGRIAAISTTGVTLTTTDEYYIFNFGQQPSSQSNCTDGVYYWNNSCCSRCVKYNNVIATYGATHQPMVNTSRTSYSGSALEGAGGTSDSSWHVLSKMGIFIR